MNRRVQSELHQRRSKIKRRAKSTETVEFFNLLTSPQLLETTEALLPEHRERLYPPTVTLAMFMRQVLEAVGADSNLSHRADRILSQGWKPTLRWSAVDKFSSWPVSLTSWMLC